MAKKSGLTGAGYGWVVVVAAVVWAGEVKRTCSLSKQEGRARGQQEERAAPAAYGSPYGRRRR